MGYHRFGHLCMPPFSRQSKEQTSPERRPDRLEQRRHPVRGREPGWLGLLTPSEINQAPETGLSVGPIDCNGLDQDGHAPQLPKGRGRGEGGENTAWGFHVIVTSMAGSPRPGPGQGCVQLPRLLSSRWMNNARIPPFPPSARKQPAKIIDPSCSPAASSQTPHSPRALNGNAGG